MASRKGTIGTYYTTKLLEAFKIHCEVAGDEPILIVGPSGVGKSVFLKEFERIEKAHGRPEPTNIDCSMFIGEDPNIAKSALFGHAEGAFTGANKEKKGLIEATHKKGSALILDEVGELPPGVQAMLLVYLETGRFRPVGATKEKTIKTKVVAATNREEKLRKELRYRFFKFYVSGLHERREDILHLFAYLFEDLFKKLRFYEILSLLSYNWPGNIRELKQVGMMLQCYQQNKDYSKKLKDIAAGTFQIDNKWATGFSTNHLYLFAERLRSGGINMNRFHKLLETECCDLETFLQRPKSSNGELMSILGWAPFSNDDVWEKTEGEYVVMSEQHFEAIRRVEDVFELYCRLLSLDKTEDVDLMQLEKWEFNQFSSNLACIQLEKCHHDEAKNFSKEIEDYLCESDTTSKPDLSNLTYDEMESEYFTQLLKKTDGNKAGAARLAGLPTSTFKDKLKKYNL